MAKLKFLFVSAWGKNSKIYPYFCGIVKYPLYHFYWYFDKYLFIQCSVFFSILVLRVPARILLFTKVKLKVSTSSTYSLPNDWNQSASQVSPTSLQTCSFRLVEHSCHSPVLLVTLRQRACISSTGVTRSKLFMRSLFKQSSLSNSINNSVIFCKILAHRVIIYAG